MEEDEGFYVVNLEDKNKLLKCHNPKHNYSDHELQLADLPSQPIQDMKRETTISNATKSNTAQTEENSWVNYHLLLSIGYGLFMTSICILMFPTIVDDSPLLEI